MRPFRVATLCLLAAALPMRGAAAVVFDDGGIHTIDDDTYAGDMITVSDSEAGGTTTANVVDPASIGGGSAVPEVSILAKATHGGQALVNISGGTLEARVDALSNSRVTISNGSFGLAGVGESVSAGAFGGTAVVEVLNGTFAGSVNAGSNSRVIIAGGSFGAAILGLYSVDADASAGTAVVHVTGGTFDSGAQAGPHGRVRIAGGAFGGGGFPSRTSVLAETADGTAVVEVFGGTFTDELAAKENGMIHVYGFGLDITDGVLTGLLADRTPINADVSETDGGQILLHNVLAEVVTVPAGPHLLTTAPGSVLELDPDGTGPGPGVFIDMTGQPLHAFDFGSGPVQLGLADTIVQRTAPATNPGTLPAEDAVPIELVALQLVSTEPVDLAPFGGSGTDLLFLTLQSDRGHNPADPLPGEASTGEMTVDFGMRTFEWLFDVFFDLRVGSLDGPILLSSQDRVQTVRPAPWSPDRPDGVLAISGLNDDFFAGVIGGSLIDFDLQGSLFTRYHLRAAELIPEPSTFPIWALGLLWLGLSRSFVGRFRHRRSGS